MSSQSQIYDQIYQQRSSEFINRQRIANEQYAKRQEKEQSKRIKAIRAMISQANETQRKVRLHHPSTRRQIGEAVKVHYKSDHIMMFELVNHPGKMLRVNPAGKVEFAAVHDETAVFELEAMYSGNLYFMCTAYRESENTAGSKGWYLSMSDRGQLTGNGGKGVESQWLMLTEQPPQPNGVVDASGAAVAAVASAVEGNNGSVGERSVLASETNLIMNQADGAAAVLANSSTNSGIGPNDAGTDGTFPGVGAGREALMKYFLSTSGVKFLQQPEYKAAYALYVNNGVLAKILHRPDWPLVANRFVDYTAQPTPPLRKSIVDACFTYSELKSYFEHGYVVGRAVIPPELATAALKVVNYWVSRHMHTLHDHHATAACAVSASNSATPEASVVHSTTAAHATHSRPHHTEGLLRKANNSFELTGAIISDIDIMALYYATPAVQVVQRLLGAGDVANPVCARIVTTFPTLELTDSPALFGTTWSIEGFTSAGGHSPYTLLLGVALTDVPETNNGNFCVHAGSHMVLLEEYQAQVERKSTTFSENGSKIDLGEPTQLLLRAGDIFLCSQRCATLQASNAGAVPTTIVYFRLSHLDHACLKNTALESLWVEYKSASYYLESTDEASAEEAQAEIEARVRAQQQAQAAKAAAARKKAAPSAPSAPVARTAAAAGSVARTGTNTAKTATPTAGATTAPATAAIAASSSGVPKKVAKPSPAKPVKTGTPQQQQPQKSSTSPASAAARATAVSPNTGENRAKVFSAKQNHLLMDLLDVRQKEDDLWGDSPLPLPAVPKSKSASSKPTSAETTAGANNANTPTAESKTSDATSGGADVSMVASSGSSSPQVDISCVNTSIAPSTAHTNTSAPTPGPVPAATSTSGSAPAEAPSTMPSAVSVVQGVEADATAQYAEASLSPEGDTYNPISVFDHQQQATTNTSDDAATAAASGVAVEEAPTAQVAVEAFPAVPTRPVVLVAEAVGDSYGDGVDVADAAPASAQFA